MKKIYNTAQLRIVAIRQTDVIATSDTFHENSLNMKFGRGNMSEINDDTYSICFGED